jgi:hypothetical protein
MRLQAAVSDASTPFGLHLAQVIENTEKIPRHDLPVISWFQRTMEIELRRAPMVRAGAFF